MKTNKAIAKRFKVTKTGKVIKRCAGQDHFNSRESGKVTRNKRRDVKVKHGVTSTIKKNIL
jgi:large subunit ribosomal protein L35